MPDEFSSPTPLKFAILYYVSFKTDLALFVYTLEGTVAYNYQYHDTRNKNITDLNADAVSALWLNTDRLIVFG